MSEEKPKKKRSPNFSNDEVDLLCELVLKYSSIIESKKSDALAWQEKLDCWKELTSAFNTQNNGPPRTVTTLRGKYEAFKKDLRKKAAKHRQALYKTGGGDMEVPSLTPSEEKIYDIISLSINGLSARFDDDGINEAKRYFEYDESDGDNDSNEPATKENKVVDTSQKGNEEIIYIEVSNDVLDVDAGQAEKNQKNEDPKSKINTWKDWNPKSLKSPISKSLQVNRKKHYLTKLQASQKVNALAEVKKELVSLQIEYLKKVVDYEERHSLIKIKKSEEELKITQLDIEIKEIEKRIKQETLKAVLQKNSSFNFPL